MTRSASRILRGELLALARSRNGEVVFLAKRPTGERDEVTGGFTGGYNGQAYSPAGDKGRYVLPPAFRKAVRESSDGRILCLAKHERWDCLVGFGLSREAELEAQLDREERNALEAKKDFDRDKRAIQLFGFSQLPFDDSGRFVLPEHLADIGKIEGGVFFQGAGRFFTLWNPDVLAGMGEGWEGAQAACASLVAEAEARAKKK